MDANPYIVAFICGGFFTGLELVTGKYANTWFAVRRSGTFWFYCLIYSVLAAIGYALADVLLTSGQMQLEAIAPSRLLRAAMLGVAVKSLLHINLFNVTMNAQRVPIGLETLVQVFEPHMLRTILLDEFNAVRGFLGPVATRYPQLADVQRIIVQNIPPTLPAQEVAAFSHDLGESSDSMEALEKGLRFLGKKTFARIFP